MLLTTGGDGVNGRHQQAEATTSACAAGADREAFRDAVSVELCIQALHRSCLLPFLDTQLSSASFNDMASRQDTSFQEVSGCSETDQPGLAIELWL